MKNIRAYLMGIHDKMGLPLAFYGVTGERLFATPDFPLLAQPIFPITAGEIAVSLTANLTSIKVKTADNTYFIVIRGTGENVKNYALLIASALEIGGKSEGKMEDKIRMLLLGEMSVAQENMLKASLAEVKFNHYMLALVTTGKEKQENLRAFLETVADKSDYIVTMDETTILYFRYAIDSEYRGADDFATILYENIKEEQRIDLAIATGGIIKSFHSLHGCYERVLLTHKFGKITEPNKNVYFYKDYAVFGLLGELPQQDLMKSLDSLLSKTAETVFSDTELMETADEFMRNSLNISETSRNMYIHRNTLIYRLDKIENETGLNLRNFNDAVAFKFIKNLASLTKSEN